MTPVIWDAKALHCNEIGLTLRNLKDNKMTKGEAKEDTRHLPSLHWGDINIQEFPKYAVEDSTDIWYDSKELSSIRFRALQLAIKSVKVGKRGCKDGDDSFRGLESMTALGRNDRANERVSLDSAIRAEQARQKAKGIHDEAAIARISQAETQQNVQRALKWGREDEASADKILQRVRDPSSKTGKGKNTPDKPRAGVGGTFKQLLFVKSRSGPPRL